MKRWLSPLLALGVFAAGCSNLESKVPGTWTDANGASMTLTKEKTWTATVGPLALEGTWKIEGEDVVTTPTKVNGKTVAEVKQAALKQPALMANPQAKQFMDDLDKSNYYKVASDGKTMTTDKAKDKNSGPSVTLTKQGS